MDDHKIIFDIIKQHKWNNVIDFLNTRLDLDYDHFPHV